MKKSDVPEVKRLLGIGDDLGQKNGLSADWAYQAIKQVGNYADIFERHLGEGTRLGLSRGQNKVWKRASICSFVWLWIPALGGTSGTDRSMTATSLPPPRRPRFALPRGERAWRAFAIQAVVLILIAAFLAWVASNVVTNITRLNINTGFTFLARPAGFEISQKPINYGHNASYFDVFIISLLNTVFLTAIAIVFATVLGFVIGLARLSSNQLVAGVAAGYVEIVRNVPLLLQLFYWYFAVLRP